MADGEVERLCGYHQELVGTKYGQRDKTAADELERVREDIKKRIKGSLRFHYRPMTEESSKATADVTWEGEEDEKVDAYQAQLRNLPHESLNLYYRKTYTESCKTDDYQDDVLLNTEAEVGYHGEIPGTTSVKGFGIEIWEDNNRSETPKTDHVRIPAKKLPIIKERSLLRRVDEMQRGVAIQGRSPEQEDADLREFAGDLIKFTPGKDGPEQYHCLNDFCDLLSQTDVFSDFNTKPSVSFEWVASKGTGHSRSNLLWQIVLAKELAIRLCRTREKSSCRISRNVLASLIIQDLWLQNVQIIMEHVQVNLSGLDKNSSDEVQARARDCKAKGEDAMEKKQWKEAKEYFAKAIDLDLGSAECRASRAVADLRLGNWAGAVQDSSVATKIDPQYLDAWEILAAAWKLAGNHVRSLEAYRRAVQVAGDKATPELKKCLEDAEARVREMTDPEKELDQLARDEIRRQLGNQKWDPFLHRLRLQSRCHKTQVAGLVRFAQEMQWPHIDELRDYTKDVWEKSMRGMLDSCCVLDWLLGVTLPGNKMAFNLMCSLVELSPSVSNLHLAQSSDHGLSLPQCSYWRSRSVLGRVLGAWPGVSELCGWIGPCPPVVLDHSVSKKKVASYILCDPSLVPAIKSSDAVLADPDHRLAHWRLRPNEDFKTYVSEMTSDKSWIYPRPPTQELKPVAVKAIRLRQLSFRPNSNEKDVEYKATIDFSFVLKKIVPLTKVVSFTLYTTPIFITLPACKGGDHPVHTREMHQYDALVVPVHNLRDHSGKMEKGRLMVVNATCNGGELMARAWCAEKGRNAVIRRPDGPCYTCALRGASKGGVAVGLLIWVS